MDSGVATRPIADMDAYRERLNNFVYQSGFIMKPVFDAAKKAPRRVLYCEGEDERVLRAVQVVIDEGLAQPVVIGRPGGIATRIEKAGLRIVAGRDFEVVNPESDPRYKKLWQAYHQRLGRHGVTPEVAKQAMRLNTTLIGAMLLAEGDVDAMLCADWRAWTAFAACSRCDRVKAERPQFCRHESVAVAKTHAVHLRYVCQSRPLGRAASWSSRLMAAEEVRRVSVSRPKLPCCHIPILAACVWQQRKNGTGTATDRVRAPDLEVDGEMHGDAALSQADSGTGISGLPPQR